MKIERQEHTVQIVERFKYIKNKKENGATYDKKNPIMSNDFTTMQFFIA